MNVYFHEDGSLSYVASSEAQQFARELLGADYAPTRRRASHVEPTLAPLRGLFHLIRRSVSENHPLANWTRRWPCRWRVRILPAGPTFGTFWNRQAAIRAEIRWLNEHPDQHQRHAND